MDLPLPEEPIKNAIGVIRFLKVAEQVGVVAASCLKITVDVNKIGKKRNFPANEGVDLAQNLIFEASNRFSHLLNENQDANKKTGTASGLTSETVPFGG